MDATSIDREELGLLDWLSTDDGQYGECSGKTLDRLMDKALVEWKRHDGRGRDFGWVGLTDDGWAALKAGREACSHPYQKATQYTGKQCGICGGHIDG